MGFLLVPNYITVEKKYKEQPNPALGGGEIGFLLLQGPVQALSLGLYYVWYHWKKKYVYLIISVLMF